MNHMSDIEIERYLDDSLPLIKKSFVKLHLNDCPDCREKLERFRKERAEFMEMVPVLRKLEEADRKSSQTTRQTVTSIFQKSDSGSEK